MNIEIRYDCRDIDWNLVASILKTVGMGGADPEVCKKAFQASYVKVFVFDGENMIGFARAISDGIREAAIYHVAVTPEYHGKGIGRKLIEAIKEKVPGCNIILYANPGKEKFYEKLGFRPMKTGMAIFCNAEEMKERGFTE